MLRHLLFTVALLAPTVASSQPGSPPNPDVDTYFRQYIGLSQDQIASIRNGQPVTKSLPSRTPAEVFLFGAVYIHAAPESYIKFAHDYKRQRKLPGNLAFGVFSDPPRPSDLKGFTFDSDDIKVLKNCKPGDSLIQMPVSSIERLQQSINWSAPDVNDQVNQQLQKTALQRLLDYQQDGNQALGVYNDKCNPTEVPKQFAYMLSYDKALPAYLPDFYRYLLDYPNAKPANVEDTFYGTRVKFGLKPTLRVVTSGDRARQPFRAYSLCNCRKAALLKSLLRNRAGSRLLCSGDRRHEAVWLLSDHGHGFRAGGPDGPKGAIVRKAAVGRSGSNLQSALTTIKNALESSR
jgi:hypothetical protein